MQKTQHTPGPYEIEDNGDKLRIYSEGIEQDLAQIHFEQGDYSDLPKITVLANANLFKHAPDLLDALKDVLASEYDRDEESRNFGPDYLEDIEKLIKKAETPYQAGMFLNKYEHCGERWTDIWSCACNDRCPICDREIEPYETEESK